MSELTIIMYHYVREFNRSIDQGIKGRSVSEFRNQLNYIKKKYHVIDIRDVIFDIMDLSALPPNSCWLTFDDGYLDHYRYVLPILDDFGFKGSFFPPAKPILNREILDVNKIHYILAKQPDVFKIIDEIRTRVAQLDQFEDGMSFDAYWAKYAKPGRYDTQEVVFVKKMLQAALPDDVRHIICNRLFEQYVTSDPKAFVEELYMNEEQLKAMIHYGMYVGCHGYEHRWLNHISAEAQKGEVLKGIDFLRKIGSNVKQWVMCYPYGAWDDSLLSILRENNCVIGLTTIPGVSDINIENRLLLKRLDTNDLPF